VRKKSPRVVWLPPTNANSIAPDPALGPFVSGIQTLALNPTIQTGVATVGEIPITIDSQDDPLDPTTSLADLESSGYRLRRIVGKIWCRIGQNDGAAQAPTFCVTAGLIIRRSDPATGQSYALSAGLVANLAPIEITSYGDPWIWRRSWFLSNNLAPAIGPAPAANADNYSYGPSAVDGPHVDQKTARLVGPEERLFLDVSATLVDAGSNDAQTTNEVTVWCDLRVLASMRTSSGNRRNASR